MSKDEESDKVVERKFIDFKSMSFGLAETNIQKLLDIIYAIW